MRVAIDSHLSWQQRQQRMSRWELPICRLLHERSSAPVLAWIFVPFAVLGPCHASFSDFTIPPTSWRVRSSAPFWLGDRFSSDRHEVLT